MEGVVGFDKGA